MIRSTVFSRIRSTSGRTVGCALVAVLLLGVGLLPGLLPAAPSTTAAQLPELPERKDGHRVLRDNVPATYVAPTEPTAFEGYADAPPFSVVPRLDELRFYPCETCHAALPLNREPRRLMAPHPAALQHGGGRIWCLSCHSAEHRNELETLAGERVGFDEAPRVCGQCHFEQHRDWYYGAHGKRLANWQGERVIYSCTHCHDPHDPAVKSRAPEPPPPVRRGLEGVTIGVHNGEEQP